MSSGVSNKESSFAGGVKREEGLRPSALAGEADGMRREPAGRENQRAPLQKEGVADRLEDSPSSEMGSVL